MQTRNAPGHHNQVNGYTLRVCWLSQRREGLRGGLGRFESNLCLVLLHLCVWFLILASYVEVLPASFRELLVF